MIAGKWGEGIFDKKINFLGVGGGELGGMAAWEKGRRTFEKNIEGKNVEERMTSWYIECDPKKEGGECLPFLEQVY